MAVAFLAEVAVTLTVISFSLNCELPIRVIAERQAGDVGSETLSASQCASCASCAARCGVKAHSLPSTLMTPGT